MSASARRYDDVLIASLLAGRTAAEAAETAGVDERTVRRRRQDADFRKRYDEARRELRDVVVARLADAAIRAVEVQRELLEAPTPAAVRRMAARDVLAQLESLGEAPDLARALGELRDDVDELRQERRVRAA